MESNICKLRIYYQQPIMYPVTIIKSNPYPQNVMKANSFKHYNS